MKKTTLVGVLIWCSMILFACGGSSGNDTGDGGSGITSISDLPGATTPMASSVSTSVVKLVEKATVGLPIGSTSAGDFGPDSSMGACEMFNLVKEGISSAAQADMILCYVKSVNDSYAFDNLADSDGNLVNDVDIYDGQYHVFNMNFVDQGEENEGGPDRIKMRVVKDASGSITNFEMFMCSLVDGQLVQNEYVNQVIDGTGVTMRALGYYQDPDWQGSHSVDVTGTLDANGHYLERSISVDNAGSSDTDQNSQHGVLVQEPGSFTFSGYRSGIWNSPQGDSGTHQDVIFGLGEMLNDSNTDIALIALGDGAVRYDSAGTFVPLEGDPDMYTYDGIEAWLGDTTFPVLPPEDSAFYQSALDGELPTVADVNIAFAADEVWDCTDDVGVGILTFVDPISQAALDAECSSYVLDHEWINCWEIIEQGQEQ